MSSKLQNLTVTTTPVSTDIAYLVVDPTGTPVDRQSTWSDVSKALVSDNLPNTPAGSIAATDTQAAINELDTEKAADADVVKLAGAQTITGTKSLSGVAFNENKGGDIASAGTTDIGAATGNFVFVTGTTTITGLGTVQAGTSRIVKFTGILILTQNATSLILPTAANITTAVDDRAEFISLGSGNWICTNYQRADGTALAAAGGGGGVSNLFSANIGTTQSINTSSVTVVDYDTEQFDTGGDFDTSTSAYTIPSTGKYFFGCTYRWANPGVTGLYSVRININAGTGLIMDQRNNGNGSDGVSNVGTAILDLMIGDTIDIRAFQNTGGAEDINAGTATSRFFGYKLS